MYSLLDCTLRDGGYVNNWNFGKKEINNIITKLNNSGVDLIELGFMRNEQFNENRTILPSIESANKLLTNGQSMYSTMIEAFNPFPVNKLSQYNSQGVNLIRICIWKRCMNEHIEYCRKIESKGYKISIQPSRVEQYSNNEFIEMLKQVNDLHPFSVYVVDTWGTQEADQIEHYAELAEKYLDKGIKIGYHGHNNKMQALSCAVAFLAMQLTHDQCIDASIMGMGRGAGNLNTEIIMDFMNKYHGTHYNIDAILDAYYSSLSKTYKATPWGYNMYHFLCSSYNSNPNFANYFKDSGYSELRLAKFLSSLRENEKIIFSKAFVETKLSELGI